MRRRTGWPGTLSAMPGGSGCLLALSDGGTESRCWPAKFFGGSFGGCEPGPAGFFGLACAG